MLRTTDSRPYREIEIVCVTNISFSHLLGCNSIPVLKNVL